MISERDIAEKFSVIWKQNFPLLSPNFIRIFNETQIEVVNTNPVPTTDDVRYDLISESAFNLSEGVIKSNTKAIDFLSDKNNLDNLIAQTVKGIGKKGNYVAADLN